ncbi:VOC family protein [Agromyces sp. NPDC055520]
MVTILVHDLDGFLRAAADRGVIPDGREEYGEGVGKAVFHDPDGNEFGVGTVPEG